MYIQSYIHIYIYIKILPLCFIVISIIIIVRYYYLLLCKCLCSVSPKSHLVISRNYQMGIVYIHRKIGDVPSGYLT